MTSTPEILLLHGFPPETAGTPADLRDHVEEALPDVDLRLATDHDDARERVPDAEVVIEHGITDDLLDRAESLEWLQSLSAGVDRYDLDALAERGVLLTNVSGVHANPIAEHVLALALAFERRLPRAIEQQRDGEWRRFPAGELRASTLGVVGVGAIGGRVADLASAVGMEVLGVKRDTTTYNDAVDEIHPPGELHTVLGRSDYVVLACPLTEETEGMIGARELASIGPEGVLLNVARGAIVDRGALVTQIQEGYLGGAALDVTDPEPLPPESPLWDSSDVILTPHMAGGSPEFPRRCAEVFVENYRRYVGDEVDAMRNRVV
ncbi:MAG: D-2-hydroxyacid dehydrogenase [Haloarculaceae archaeon]